MGAAEAAAGAPGASLAPGQAPPAPGAALAAEGGKKAEANLVAGEKREAAPGAALVPGEAKAKGEEGAAAKGEGDDKAPLWSGAKEDEELVDPDADRPDFGTDKAKPSEAEDEEEEDDEDTDEEEDDDETAEVAGGKAKAPFALKPERDIDPAYVTAGLMVIAMISLGSLLWMQRVQLSKMWPGFDAVYKKMGLETKRPGEGLRIAQSGAPRLLRIGGIETLVVKGYISNIDTKPRDVPHIKLQLLDATGAVVQETDTTPSLPILSPGASINYELKMELPNMAAAKSVAVNWPSE
jgi:hypothetical protein